MIELVALVEGETEQTFVRDQLAAHLGLRNTVIWAVLPGRNRKQGGVKEWRVAQEDILRLLKQGRHCTTMFDLYGLPDDWPGRIESKRLPWQERASHVEARLSEALAASLGTGFNPKQFIPYIQLHEFEALAFADVEVMASATKPLSLKSEAQLVASFRGILEEKGHPEAINDGYETCPSRRIEGVVKAYRKKALGPIITQRIGLETLRARCPHFGSWLGKLEALT